MSSDIVKSPTRKAERLHHSQDRIEVLSISESTTPKKKSYSDSYFQGPKEKTLEDFEELLKDVNPLQDEFLTEEEKQHPWRQPLKLYYLVAVAAMGALIVGIDISLVSGAQIEYLKHFNITNTNITGLLAAGTTLGALVGSMLSIMLNEFIGRRGSLFVASIWSIGASLWEALAPSWKMLLAGRLMLGVSMGIISSTVPVLLSEAVPTAIRGAIASLYQQMVATGIFIGYIVDVIFVNIDEIGWRLMLGATIVPAIFEAIAVPFQVESPRWLIKKGKMEQAEKVLLAIRLSSEHALRDLVLIRKAVEEERKMTENRNLYWELLTVPSLRRELFVGTLLMLFQQFCGMNVFMYYVDYMFTDLIGISDRKAVLASLIAGFTNAIFTLPVYWIIDKYGRRSLQLWTFPIMCAMQVLALFSYYGTKWVNFGLFMLAVFVFIAAYSPANGPVPWVYCPEIFPLYVRAQGMAITTFFNYLFNFVVSYSWPDMLNKLKAQGGYGFYAAAIAAGWVLLFFFMPETKGYTLEQMGMVFEHSLGEIARYHWKCGIRNVRKLFGLATSSEPLASPYNKKLNLKMHGVEE
jgi:sugar porter (SP) family MFS transporter